MKDSIDTVNQRASIKCVLDGADAVPYWVADDDCQLKNSEKMEAQKFLWGRGDDESCIEANKGKLNSTELANACGIFSRQV